MNEKVKAYLEKQEALKSKEYHEKKLQLAKDLGLGEKEYSADGGWSKEYNNYEWDNVGQKANYYKFTPIELTDEEYEKLKEYSDNSNEVSNKKKYNVVALLLKVIAGLIFGCGFISGIAISYDTRDLIALLICWCSAFVSGVVFLGFAEIIQLLDDIKKK